MNEIKSEWLLGDIGVLLSSISSPYDGNAPFIQA